MSDTAQISHDEVFKIFSAAPGRLVRGVISELDYAAQLAYADLRSSKIATSGITIDAIWEVNGIPVLYLVKAGILESQAHSINTVARLLAARGHAACLAYANAGRLTLHPCVLQDAFGVRADIDFSELLSVLNELVQGVERDALVDIFTAARDVAVGARLLNLFRQVATVVYSEVSLGSDTAKRHACLALIGRAIFTRFLFDRGILSAQTAPDLFSKVAKGGLPGWFENDLETAKLFVWLDQTFNGEFLPIVPTQPKNCSVGQYSKLLLALSDSAKKEIRKIILNLDASGQAQLPFDDPVVRLDYSHIPVGLLSEIYEDFTHTFDEENATKESKHYTPRLIASMMVNQIFDAMPEEKRSTAVVLDPAAGAGVFLVLTLQRIALELWRNTKQQPTADQIREILYRQIRGFDKDGDALMLATLSLYLAAVELNANPLPPETLCFPKPLLGSVLIPVGDDELGSIGHRIGAEWNAKFDVVLGNPPWTSKAKGVLLSKEVDTIVSRVIGKYDNTKHHATYRLRDYHADVPFIWRAMEWAKPEAWIAFVIHGRFLFQTSSAAWKQRQPLLNNLDVTGFLNAADFSDEKLIWPGMAQPFCILFAKNQLPEPGSAIWIQHMYKDPALNALSRLRLDPTDISAFTLDEWQHEPWLMKAIYRGGQYDVGIIRKMKSSFGRRQKVELAEYWFEKVGGKGGEGYKVGNRKKSAAALYQLKGNHFPTKQLLKAFISHDQYNELKVQQGVEAIRDLKIYRTPLVLVKESGFSLTKRQFRATLAFGPSPVIYSESFFGYSAEGVGGSDLHSKYLFLISNSRLLTYYLLMTDEKFGAERRAINKSTFESFPIVPFDALKESEIKSIDELVKKLDVARVSNVLWTELDEWVESLYGLSEIERDVITDTLAMNMPYGEVRTASVLPPRQSEIAQFLNVLSTSVNAQLEADAIKLIFSELKSASNAAWIFFHVCPTEEQASLPTTDGALAKLATYIGDNTGSSHAFIRLSDKSFLIGVLFQRRFLTRTKARLIAQYFVEQWDSQHDATV